MSKYPCVIPPKALSRGGFEPSPNTWFLGSHGVRNPNGISVGSTVFAGLTPVSDRYTETHRPRYIGDNRPHLMLGTVMRHN